MEQDIIQDYMQRAAFAQQEADKFKKAGKYLFPAAFSCICFDSF